MMAGVCITTAGGWSLYARGGWEEGGQEEVEEASWGSAAWAEEESVGFGGCG